MANHSKTQAEKFPITLTLVFVGFVLFQLLFVFRFILFAMVLSVFPLNDFCLPLWYLRIPFSLDTQIWWCYTFAQDTLLKVFTIRTKTDNWNQHIIGINNTFHRNVNTFTVKVLQLNDIKSIYTMYKMYKCIGNKGFMKTQHGIIYVRNSLLPLNHQTIDRFKLFKLLYISSGYNPLVVSRTH